jgi:DNA mismatch repair ATPase MutL
MQLSDVITENNNISELVPTIIDTNFSSILSVDSSISSSSTSESSSSDSMESSDDDSTDSMSLSSESITSNEDSSSDYSPSDTSMDISSSESEESEESEEEQKTKKRKRNPLDSFCLYSIRPKNPDDTNLYIGSTVNFNRRKQQHKKAVTNKRGGTYYCILYRYIRKCGGWDNFTMEKILDYPCETKHEGLLKEKEYIIKHEATLNSVMPVSDDVSPPNGRTKST